MLVQQLYTQCLAQGAYFIVSDGEAAIIDPLRETQPYLNLLTQNKASLKYIFETHFHADFVSGHVDLANKTNAQIVYGPQAQTTYKSHIAKDNEEFKVGKLTIKVLHTPGHTLESTTYLLLDESKKPHCIFTGDTLFIGDVGRPDLAIKSTLTQEDLAGMLYDSLRNKIMTLPDDVLVYPAHGAGSACGKNMSKETFDTLGNQKKTNYALANISKQDFIKELTTGILPPPQYFAKNAALNKEGYHSFDEVMQKGSKALSVNEFEQDIKKGALVLDVRKAAEFAKGHVPNALFIGLDGQFAPWVGALITDLKQPIILVTPQGKEEETVMRLSRVGYDNCLGYLAGGFDTWKQAGKNTEDITSISAEEFSTYYGKENVNVLDVRKPGEYDAKHLNNVNHKALDFISDWQDSLDKNKNYYIHCAGGYRSMIAASILKTKGYKNLVDVAGGFGAIVKTGIPASAYAVTCANA
ncbi:MAG TPA: MBL fold metallo-hydrolase [Bacteroidia bacterium]|nr:MBL fold metallo-hydrolase [Bacteroidia bacterium]